MFYNLSTAHFLTLQCSPSCPYKSRIPDVPALLELLDSKDTVWLSDNALSVEMFSLWLQECGVCIRKENILWNSVLKCIHVAQVIARTTWI